MDSDAHLRLMSLAGLFVMVAIAWSLSENRAKINWRLAVYGVGLQFAFGLLILRTAVGRALFEWVKTGFDAISQASTAGAAFLFGDLTRLFIIRKDALLTPDDNIRVNAGMAFQALPTIIFVSALAGMLLHLGVIQALVRSLAWVMRRTLKTSGAETFATALLVFMGIESMSAVRGYLDKMTRSELCTIMTAFMATIAASVMVAYTNFGAQPGHLLAASIMSAPAAIVISKLLVPETGEPQTGGGVRVEVPVSSHNIIDAAARGAGDGLIMAMNVGAMLIAFVGLVFLLDLAFAGVTGFTFERLMGWVFQPFAVLMGVSWQDSIKVGELLGIRAVLNEFIAYSNIKPLTESGALGPRSAMIATYALCGFANPGSIGILIGGLSSLVPGRRSEIAALGIKSYIAGMLACFMTACVAGVLADE